MECYEPVGFSLAILGYIVRFLFIRWDRREALVPLWICKIDPSRLDFNRIGRELDWRLLTQFHRFSVSLLAFDAE
jgi:hypothetical protein